MLNSSCEACVQAPVQNVIRYRKAPAYAPVSAASKVQALAETGSLIAYHWKTLDYAGT